MTTTSWGQSVTATVTAAPDRGVDVALGRALRVDAARRLRDLSLHGDDAAALLRKISEEYG